METNTNQQSHADKMAALAVGDGVSWRIGSDYYPATIIARTAATITIQEDSREGLGEFAADPDGAVRVFRRGKNGGYKATGCKHTHLIPGRKFELDPSF